MLTVKLDVCDDIIFPVYPVTTLVT